MYIWGLPLIGSVDVRVTAIHTSLLNDALLLLFLGSHSSLSGLFVPDDLGLVDGKGHGFLSFIALSNVVPVQADVAVLAEAQ